jgi:hypothetical protein
VLAPATPASPAPAVSTAPVASSPEDRDDMSEEELATLLAAKLGKIR